MTDFDLRQHIRTILAETTEENLEILADLIFDRTPHKNTRDAYRQALSDAVRREIGSVPRARMIRDDLNIEQDTDTTGEGQTRIATQSTLGLPGGQNLKTSRATMFRLAMALRRAGFRESIWIGDGVYRPLMECTTDQLEFAAAESDSQANANFAAARRYRLLKKLLEQHGVEKVADLPIEAVEELNSSE